MTLFYQAFPAEQSLLMVALLLTLISSLFSLIAAFGSEKSRLYKYMETGLFLLLFVILTRQNNQTTTILLSRKV